MEFRLIVEAASPVSKPSVELEGKHWVLSDPFDLDQPGSIPKYSCVSYVWGDETDREPHSLLTGTTMSTHTIPALTAAIRAKKSNAFWIDTFCVPPAEPTKRFTLESMGFIYSESSEVVIMLSSCASEAIKQMSERDRLTEDALIGLEQDNWVTRIWTYQELANAVRYYFVYEGASKTIEPLDGDDFFSCLGFSLTKLGKEKGIDVMNLFPKLSNLEDLLAESWATPLGQRSALVVMTSMQRRTMDNVQNLFYAMTCAVTTTITTKAPPGLFDMVDQSPAETFMTACEQRNDYSFIYSSDERDKTPGRRWRPKASRLTPILSFHSYGEAQRAHRTSEGLWLDEMLSFTASSKMDPEGRDWIMWWLKRPIVLVENADCILAEACILKLKELGFQGLPGNVASSQTLTETDGVPQSLPPYLILRDGIFVPQRPVEKAQILRILVSNQISWLLGAPGLVEITGIEGSEYVVGVYVGYKVGLKPGADLISALL